MFFGNKIIYRCNRTVTAKMKFNKRKLPVHWLPNIPKRYNENAFMTDLYRVSSISS